MPRHVDANERRADVAHAVWRVVIRDGLGGATVRRVAEEAGLSVGALRHYFSEQRGLHAYAYELIGERVDQRLAAVDMTLPVRERIEEIMWAMLPVSAEQVEEEQVRLAYLIESRTDPSLAELLRTERAESEALTRQAVIGLRDSGEAPAGLDVDAATDELLAVLDGLAQAAALNPDTMTPDRLRRAVRRWLDNLRPAGTAADCHNV